MLEPPVLHVFSEVPCQILMFFWRFHVGTSSFACFFRGSMSKLPVLDVILEVP